MSKRYIWRTQGDNRVRSGHANRNGKIFHWDNPPEGGHPGESPNCRCYAEEISDDTTRWIRQDLKSGYRNSSSEEWDNLDFIIHFYFGNGSTVKLENIGLKEAIIDRAKEVAFQNFENQILEKTQEEKPDDFRVDFVRSYDFLPVKFSLGDSTLSGHTAGYINYEGDLAKFKGEVHYYFGDAFTDPLDIRTLEKYLIERLIQKKIYVHPNFFNEVGGTGYDILGSWITDIEGEISVNR